jgi:hypothetical protein
MAMFTPMIMRLIWLKEGYGLWAIFGQYLAKHGCMATIKDMDGIEKIYYLLPTLWLKEKM